MPKTTKARRVTLPASVIMRPTGDDIAAFGSPNYAIDETTGNAFFYAPMPENFAATLGVNPLNPENVNETLRVFIDNSGDDYGAPDIVLYDATAPEPETIEPSEPEPVASAAAAPPAPSTVNDRAIARALAARAVAAFYSGASLPFKSAHDLKRKSAINFALRRDATRRSAALLAAILTYCDVQPGTLTFVRGSGRVPRRLLGYTDRPDETSPAGPESGGLSNCIPDRIEYVSGPLAGDGCENAVFRIVYSGARANLLAHNDKQPDGEHLFSAPLALLDLLAKAPPTGDSTGDSTGDNA